MDDSRRPDKFVARAEIVGEDGFVFGGWMAPSPLMLMLWCLLGISEDILHGAWQVSLPVISQILREEGDLPLSAS